jgi:hypothetical protein
MSQNEFNKLKNQFRKNPTINPETGRSITKNGDTYKSLVKKYGSPNRQKRSQQRRVKSPLKSPRLKKDAFDVLSEEAILRVLQKLNPDHRRVWCSSSSKVKAVCEKYNV